MKKKTIRIILIAIVVIALLVGIIYTAKSVIIKKDKQSTISKEKLENAKIVTNDEGYVDLTLYFGGNEGTDELVKEERLISYQELVGEIIIQELIKGPASNREKSTFVLPKETRLLSFSIKDGIGYINFSSEAMFEMTEEKEEILLKSITNSLSELDSVDKVMIQVKSETVKSLGGHFDISKPFSKDEIKNLKIQK